MNFKEKVDEIALRKIIDNWNEIIPIIRRDDEEEIDINLDYSLTNQIKMLKKYYNKIKNGIYHVKYFQSPNHPNGREYPNDFIGLSTMRREIRQTITKDFYIDIDIKGSSITFTDYFADENNIITLALKNIKSDYVNLYKPNKENINKIIFGGTVDIKSIKNLTSQLLLKELQKEIKIIHKCAMDKYPELLEGLKKKSNKAGSLFSKLYMINENKILHTALDYLIEKNININNVVKIFDGFMINKEISINFQELNKYVKDKLNIDVEFVNKPFNSKEIIDLSNFNIKDTQIEKLCADTFTPLHYMKYIRDELFIYLKYCNKSWYEVRNFLWIKDVNPNKIITEISQMNITRYINEILEMVKDDNDTHMSEQSKGLAFHKNFKTTSFMTMCKGYLETLLSDNNFEEKLDTKIGFIAFKNGLFDLKRGELREGGIKPNDYLTQTLNYDYIKSNDKTKRLFVLDRLREINCNNEEYLEYYLRILGYIFTGLSHERQEMYFFIGLSANNGKSRPLEVLEQILSLYVKKINCDTFTEGISKSHKYLADLKGKLLCFINELKEKNLNVDLIKDVCDGASINNEVMYGTTEKINIKCKIIATSNYTPKFKNDNGIKRRYRQLQFTSQFVDKEAYIKLTDQQKRYSFPKIEIRDLLINEYKYEFLDIIFSYSKKYYEDKNIVIPNEFKKISEQTCSSNDQFSIFKDEYLEVDDDAYVFVKELIDKYKAVFNKTVDASYFRDQFAKENIVYDYKKRISKNRQNLKGAFKGYKFKIENFNGNEDDDLDFFIKS